MSESDRGTSKEEKTDIDAISKPSRGSGIHNEPSIVTSQVKPAGVSDAAWMRFIALKEKRMALTKKRSSSRKEKNNLSKKSGETSSEVSDTLNNSRKESDKEVQENWMEVKKYLGAFDNIEAACVNQHQEKSGLEKQMEKAIAEGDVNKAEELSDQLANREFGSKISNAFDAKRFTKRQQEKAELLNAKKKRKLNWQFEHKEKWEMKANM